VGKTRKRVAAELVADLERLSDRKKAANKELTVLLLRATGTTLTALHGIGPSDAARLLVEVGDVTQFPDRGHFASWTGTLPFDASGDNVRHRLSRGGNRKIKRVLHIMAVVQLRNFTEGRAYYDRRVAAGKTPDEAMRCLKRRLSDLVYRALLDDLSRGAATGPGGQRGNDSDSRATGSQLHTGTSDKPLPGPASIKPTTGIPKAS
jgi:transposase